MELLSTTANEKLADFIKLFEERIELKTYYMGMTDGYDRVANINEFYEYFNDYIEHNGSMQDFMNDITLQSDQDTIVGESIYLMSIHASKGLEFETVFLVGLEDGVFPIMADDVDLQEERRLAYVAITRAKEQLFLCYANNRLYKGRYNYLSKSLFLNNILGKTDNKRGKTALGSAKTSTFKKGDVVKHKVFGMGKIDGIIQHHNQQKLRINFGGQYREILSQFVSVI